MNLAGPDQVPVPVLKNPANRHRAVGFTKEQFHYAFTNTVSREESDAAYDLLHIPAPGSWVWGLRPDRQLKPGHQETWVDYDLDDRAPLLFIMGGKDHLMPPSVQRSNAKKYRNSEATTETYEFPDRSHFTGVEARLGAGGRLRARGATSHASPAGLTKRRQQRGDPSDKPSPRDAHKRQLIAKEENTWKAHRDEGRGYRWHRAHRLQACREAGRARPRGNRGVTGHGVNTLTGEGPPRRWAARRSSSMYPIHHRSRRQGGARFLHDLDRQAPRSREDS